MDKNDEKDFHQIAREIATGFIGELKHDVDYLSVKLLEYEDHPMFREIMRYSQQYLHAGLSEEEQQILDECANKKANGMEETLEKINFQLFQKDIDKAFDMTESLVWKSKIFPSARTTVRSNTAGSTNISNRFSIPRCSSRKGKSGLSICPIRKHTCDTAVCCLN